MNLRRILLCLLSLLFVLTFTSSNVNASKRHYYSNFPKSIRGNWYQYGKDKQYIYVSSLSIHKKSYYRKSDILSLNKHKSLQPESYKSVLKTPSVVNSYKKQPISHKSWQESYVKKINGYNFVILNSVFSGASVQALGSHKFGKNNVLTSGYMVNNRLESINHFYRSMKLAKLMANKKYPGFKY